MTTSHWDLSALINAVDAKASAAERHLWLVRLLEWLRHEAPLAPLSQTLEERDVSTPQPVLRLRHLFNQLERHPALHGPWQDMQTAFWREVNVASLLADGGFGQRMSFASELWSRVQTRVLPCNPATLDLAVLFPMIFVAEDGAWVKALDGATMLRAARWLGPPEGVLQPILLESLMRLSCTVQAAAFAPALQQRMDTEALAERSFHQLGPAVAALQASISQGDEKAALRDAVFLRALLDAARRACASVMQHLKEHGVSVNIVYEVDQGLARLDRIERLLDCLLAPDADSAVGEGRHLLLELLTGFKDTQGFSALLGRQYSLMARQIAQRSAEAGEHYIARDRGEHRDMLRRAVGGGLVIAGTTLLKFAWVLLGLTAFWGGFGVGVLYAASFLIVFLLNFTLATKQPAMTAAAMAATLPVGSAPSSEELNAFADRVAQLMRSQFAGIVGNLGAVIPAVLLLQWLSQALWGATVLDAAGATYVVGSLSLWGPTALFAAFTGVLLFLSSLVAGWVENWFVFHDLDGALACNPRILARLGAGRAQRWSRWWRLHIAGLAANVSLGMMLGLVPAVLAFVGLPIEVRHVTLAAGQLAAAASVLGWEVLSTAGFGWCVAGIVVIGALNLGVSFYLAFKVALRSRGTQVQDRSRILATLRERLRKAPLSFLWPPADAGAGLH